MKLATLNNNTRDGELVVVNRELTQAVRVPDIAPTLQAALDQWQALEPKLKARYDALNAGELDDSFDFDPKLALAPLPRAYQWADASAYVNHVELVRKSRGVAMPESFWTDPLMYQGGSDHFLAPCEDIPIADLSWGVDFEAEVAVIVDDIPMGATPEVAQQHIRLLMLVNDVSLRNLAPNELAKGFGFFQCKPASSFSPVAITPDELGAAWDGTKVNLPLMSYYNDKLFGKPNAGVDMTFNYPQLLAHAARTRQLCAGTILGSGTVSNKDKSVGSSCIVEKRMLEVINDGKASTPFMQYNDTVKIEMLDPQGKNIFGTIHQKVVPVT